MNEQQFRCLRDNRRARGPIRLSESAPGQRGQQTPLAAVVARAASQLRRREAGVTAWERAAPGQWLAETTVEAVEGDTLVIAVGSSSVCYELRRQQAGLEQQVRRLVPGVHRLRFVVRDGRASRA